MSYPKDNLKILGRMFKNHRTRKGYSLRGLSRAISIVHPVISDIENRKVTPNIDTLELLFNAVDVPFHTDEEQLLERRRSIDSFYEALYYRNARSIQMHYRALKRHAGELLRSPLRVEYLLVLEAYRIMVKGNYSAAVLRDLEDFYEHLSHTQRQIFNTLRGIAFFYRNIYVEAAYYFNLSKDTVENRYFHALSLSYLAFAYDAVFKNYQSLKNAERASRSHQRLDNVERKIQVDILTVKKHIDLGNTEEGSHLLQHIRQTLNGNEDLMQIFSDKVKLQLAYAAYVNQALSWTKYHLGRVRRKTPKILFYEGIIAYHLGEKERMRKTLEAMESHKSHPEYNLYYSASRLCHYYAGEIEENLDSEAETVLDSIHHIPHLHVRYFTFALLFYYYQMEEECSKAYATAKLHFFQSVDRDMHESDCKPEPLKGILKHL